MPNPADTHPETQDHAVMHSFTDCHADIVTHLDSLDTLTGLIDAAARARSIARDTVAFFDDMIVNHHEDEEQQLFPAVRKAARPGTEHEEVVALTERLTADHRQLEAEWKKIRPQLKQIAGGHGEKLDVDAVTRLVIGYKAHAHFEETLFLPLAERILSRQDPELAQLGYALHIRHAINNTPGFT